LQVYSNFNSESFGERLRLSRKRKSMTQKQLGELLGVSWSMISGWERAINRISDEYLVHISNILDISIDWLLTGEEKPEISDEFDFSPRETAKLLREDPEIHRFVNKLLAERSRRLADERRALLQDAAVIEIVTPEEAGKTWIGRRTQQFIPVPLYDDMIRIAAGQPATIESEHLEGYAIIWKDWVKNPKYSTAVRIRGDSMAPVLVNHSIICIDHSQQNPRMLQNKIIVAKIDEGVTVKYLRKKGKAWFLEPANPEYPVQPFRPDQGDTIIGRIVWSWSPR